MVDDCLNRFWLMARAVRDNCSTLQPKVARQSLVVKGSATSGLNLSLNSKRIVWIENDGGASCHYVLRSSSREGAKLSSRSC